MPDGRDRLPVAPVRDQSVPDHTLRLKGIHPTYTARMLWIMIEAQRQEFVDYEEIVSALGDLRDAGIYEGADSESGVTGCPYKTRDFRRAY